MLKHDIIMFRKHTVQKFQLISISNNFISKYGFT